MTETEKNGSIKEKKLKLHQSEIDNPTLIADPN
jgi:hypothetical protein